jgi:hypothetical protein
MKRRPTDRARKTDTGTDDYQEDQDGRGGGEGIQCIDQ